MPLKRSQFLVPRFASGANPRAACWMVLATALIACAEDRSPPTGLDRPIDVRRFVVDGAAARVDANGFYILTVQTSPNLITPERASEIAVVAARQFGPTDRTYLEGQVGAPIDFAALEAGPRAFFAESPYEQNLPADFHPAFHKRYGPYYLVPLNAGGRPVLSVAVSAYNTDVEVVDGILKFAVRHGDDFRVQGVNERWGTSVPVSPEHATRIVAEHTGARITSVPELVLPPRGYVPQYARWRVQLDRNVTLRGRQSGASYDGREYYVGVRGEIAAALKSQPVGSPVADPDRGTVNVTRRPNVPLVFEPVGR